MNKKVYIIAIGGVGTSALAGLFSKKGFEVYGSDKKLFSPTDLILKSSGVKLFEGYSIENIKKVKPDVVVIGNAVRKDNPEVVYTINNGQRYIEDKNKSGKSIINDSVKKSEFTYLNFPEALFEYFIKDKESVVITGTHGKTTTTSIFSYVLKQCGKNPGFMIGGLPLNFKSNNLVGKGKYFIVEGDEYNASCLNENKNKDAKFLYYNPKYLVINNIELDHVDIYKDINDIINMFDLLVKKMPADGVVFAGIDSGNVRKIIKNNPKTKFITFGLKNADFYPSDICFKNGLMEFDIINKNKKLTKIKTHLLGEHNILNILACFAFCNNIKINSEKFAFAVQGFMGVKKRSEIIGKVKNNILIEDFAHHPTEILQTEKSLKLAFPDKRIISIFQPSSTSSNTKVFQEEYLKSFEYSDILIIAQMTHPDSFAKDRKFDIEKFTLDIKKIGKNAFYIPEKKDIVDFVVKNINSNDIIITHSSGNFSSVIREIYKASSKI